MANVKTKWFDDFKKNELPSSLDGKVFVITGTTSGTGYVAAQVVGELGGQAVLLNRKSSRSEAMMTKLKEEYPKGKFVAVECDLQNFESVRNAAKEIQSKYTQIYCLANNAGIMATPDEATVDGYDKQMQTNHLSHFLLTAELYPLLEAYANEHGEARIVNHSSGARNMGKGTPLEGLAEQYFGKNGGNLGGNELKGIFGGAPFERYQQSKLANSVFTYALHEKIKTKNGKIKAMACHPGGSVTNLGNDIKWGAITKFLIVNVAGPFLFQSPQDGTMGLLKGMMHPDAQSGVLYGPKNDGTKGPAVPNEPNPWETDPAAMEMLWRTSEAATGVKFEI